MDALIEFEGFPFPRFDKNRLNLGHGSLIEGAFL